MLNKITKGQMAKLLAVLAEAFPNFQISESKLNLFYNCYKNISYPVMKQAVQNYIFQSQFPPTIAGLNEIILKIQRGNNDIDAISAWQQVLKAIKDHGRYNYDDAIKDLHPLTTKTLQLIGWSKLCNCDRPDRYFNYFKTNFNKLKADEDQQLLPPPKIDA